MTTFSIRAIAPVAALAVLLSLTACGGGDDEGVFVDEREPFATGLPATVTVTQSGAPALNGTYSSNNIFLNNVTKVNPIDARETCRMRFTGLAQQVSGSDRVMSGDLRYIPGSVDLHTAFASISSIEFRLDGTAGARVDRAGNRIVFTNAVLTSTQGTGQSITLTGAIPLLGDRPEGC
jgi:hypothetical protein